MRFFHTHQNIHPNHVFQPIVSAPTLEDRKPRVDWTAFHTIVPVESKDKNHSGRLDELSSLWRTSSEWACTKAALPFNTTSHSSCNSSSSTTCHPAGKFTTELPVVGLSSTNVKHKSNSTSIRGLFCRSSSG